MPSTLAEWAILVAPYLGIAGVLRWHFAHRVIRTTEVVTFDGPTSCDR
jgi:hypothetical protein